MMASVERVESVVYKRVEGGEVQLDVYPATAETQPAQQTPGTPVVLWIHGGALIAGTRRRLQASLQRELARAGFAQVSIDYRLAPETKLPSIWEDVTDAFAWVRGEGARRFGWEARRLGVLGHSAGGYLTLMAGAHLRPKPLALVSFYGYGDVAAAWYSRPDPFYCAQPAVPEERARAAVGTVAQAVSEGAGERMAFYLWCRQQGRWPQEVVGLDPERDARAFDRYCPVRSVSAEFPPALLLHGTADTDVPYAQSAEMAAALERAGVTHELVTIPDGPHGFDRDARVGDGTPAGEALRKAVEFLSERV
jgi:acetyl esterase/lipase